MYDAEAECMSVDERSALQEQRLRAAVDRWLALGGLIGERLREAGIAGGRDVTLGGLPLLPLTTKQDLWDAYPWGMLAVPREKIVAVHGSSGTRGRPTLVGYTQRDYHLWGDMCARSLGCAGAAPGSIVHNAYGYGLFTGGMGIHLGAVRMGATVVPMSGGMTQRQVTMLADLQPDVLTCTPSYAVTLGEAVREAGVALPGLKAGVFGAEPWTDELRVQIEELLPLKALDIYGLSEVTGPGVATECIEAQNGLHVNEDHFIVEALDPLTQEPVADGQPGELVFTTPTREALPLLRYRTGDIASLRREACVCGRTLVRMSKVLGRRDDMMVVRGVNVYPSEVEAVLLADGRVAPHYLLVVNRREAVPRLLVCCEALPERSVAVAADLSAGLRERLGLTADVRVFAPGTIPRQEVGKAIRVRTWQEGPPPFPELDDRAG